MKREKRITTFTCDYCGKECNPIKDLNIGVRVKDCSVLREFRLVVKGDWSDVCEDCFKAYVLKSDIWRGVVTNTFTYKGDDQ